MVACIRCLENVYEYSSIVIETAHIPQYFVLDMLSVVNIYDGM
jgi:hypothetical protein